MVEAVGELVGLGSGIDDAEDAARQQRAEHGDDRLGRVVQEDDDALAAREAELAQAAGEGAGAARELGVAEALGTCD